MPRTLFTRSTTDSIRLSQQFWIPLHPVRRPASTELRGNTEPLDISACTAISGIALAALTKPKVYHTPMACASIIACRYSLIMTCSSSESSSLRHLSIVQTMIQTAV